MEFERTPEFVAHFKERANHRIQKLFGERVTLFLKDPYDASLRNHDLDYRWKGYRSFSLTYDDGPDDYRVIYKRVGRKTYLFADFGTHDQLYRPWR